MGHKNNSEIFLQPFSQINYSNVCMRRAAANDENDHGRTYCTISGSLHCLGHPRLKNYIFGSTGNNLLIKTVKHSRSKTTVLHAANDVTTVWQPMMGRCHIPVLREL